MPISQSLRGVSFRYRPQDVGPDNFEKIIRWFKIGTPPMTILKRFSNRTTATLPPGVSISVIDIYALLWAVRKDQAFDDEMLKRRFETEMSLNDFTLVYERWRSGGGEKGCLDVLSRREQVRESVQTVYRALNKRLAQEVKRESVDHTKADDHLKKSINELLDLGVVADVDSRRAVVIFLNELNPNAVRSLAPLRIQRWVDGEVILRLRTMTFPRKVEQKPQGVQPETTN